MGVVRTILGLLVPANVWLPIRSVALPILDGEVGFHQIRTLLDCRMVEVIGYFDTPDDSHFTLTMFGDEEARLVAEPETNLRATQVAQTNIVGDVILVGYDRDNRCDISIPSFILPVLRSYK